MAQTKPSVASALQARLRCAVSPQDELPHRADHQFRHDIGVEQGASHDPHPISGDRAPAGTFRRPPTACRAPLDFARVPGARGEDFEILDRHQDEARRVSLGDGHRRPGGFVFHRGGVPDQRGKVQTLHGWLSGQSNMCAICVDYAACVAKSPGIASIGGSRRWSRGRNAHGPIMRARDRITIPAMTIRRARQRLWRQNDQSDLLASHHRPANVDQRRRP
jgi:hypothetical protein